MTPEEIEQMRQALMTAYWRGFEDAARTFRDGLKLDRDTLVDTPHEHETATYNRILASVGTWVAECRSQTGLEDLLPG